MKITVSATDVWGYFKKNKDDLKSSMHEIANNPEYGVEIFITEDSGLPSITVNIDNTEVYEEMVLNEVDCEKTVKRVYEEYLTDKVITVMTEDNVDDDTEDIITDREEELDYAVRDFVMTALNEVYVDILGVEFDKMIEDCKEHFLEYIARKHELPVYRPMFLEYDDGVEELSDYPYEDMVFEDEDNLIYKK